MLPLWLGCGTEAAAAVLPIGRLSVELTELIKGRQSVELAELVVRGCLELGILVLQGSRKGLPGLGWIFCLQIQPLLKGLNGVPGRRRLRPRPQPQQSRQRKQRRVPETAGPAPLRAQQDGRCQEKKCRCGKVHEKVVGHFVE